MPITKFLATHTPIEINQFISKLFEHVDVGIVVADNDGNFLLWNQTAVNLVGIGPKNVPITEWSNTYGCYKTDRKTLIPPEELPLAKALKGEIVMNEEIYIRNVDKPEGVWLLVSGNPIIINSFQGAVVAFKDITEITNRELELVKVIKALNEIKDKGLQVLNRFEDS